MLKRCYIRGGVLSTGICCTARMQVMPVQHWKCHIRVCFGCLLCMQVNLLPVVDAAGAVVGIVTRHDILRGIYASKNPLL